jgi:hypothetical protein
MLRVGDEGVEVVPRLDDLKGAPHCRGRRCYAREPNGTEWLVVTTPGSGTGVDGNRQERSTLWRRHPQATWEPIELPYANFSTGSNVRIDPLEVWAIDDGDVWLKAHYHEGKGMDQGVILHTKAPSEVCRFGRSHHCGRAAPRRSSVPRLRGGDSPAVPRGLRGDPRANRRLSPNDPAAWYTSRRARRSSPNLPTHEPPRSDGPGYRAHR